MKSRFLRRLLLRLGALRSVIPPDDLGEELIAEDDEKVVWRKEQPERIRTLAATDTIKRNVAFILITFRGSTAQPPTRESVLAAFKTGSQNVYDFYESLSYGATFLTGEVFGPFAVDRGTGCDYSNWRTQAKTALAASGVDLTRFTNFAVIGPRVTDCTFAGVASIGGNMIYMNGTTSWSTLCHELGHNFGLRHAKSSKSEYGDPFDRMGGGRVGFHAQYRYRIGVLTGSDVHEVKTTGIYTIGALEVPGSSPKLLRIRRPDGSYLTIETRRAVGGYAPAVGPATTGITIRAVTSAGNSATLVDVASGTTTQTDAPLPSGQAWIDPLSKIRIKSGSVYWDRSRVGVTFPVVN